MNTIKRGSRGEEVKALQRRLSLLADGIFGPLTEEAVREFQRRYGLTVDGIVGVQTWQALGVDDLRSVRKSRRSINEIIVHCSATPEGRDYTVEDIKRWHLQRGFSTIGYHYVVYRDGSIHEGRSVDLAGAHCTGHNTHSIGVCYVGGLEKDGKTPKDTRTDKQREGLAWLIKSLKDVYPRARVLGHRDTSPDKNHNGIIEPSEWIKSCPCFNAMAEYK